jgi:hypothetical protein
MQPNDDDELVNEIRGNPAQEKPFCWAAKAALKAIRRAFGDNSDLAYMNATYLALCEIASDEGRPVFTKSIAEIVAKAGAKYKKVSESLARFEQLGLIAIRRNFQNRGKAPSTYSLLSLPSDRPKVTADLPSDRPKGLGLGDSHSVPIEEKEHSVRKEKKKDSHAFRDHYSDDELKVIDLYHEICVPRGWRPIDDDSPELHDALDTFQDDDADWFRKAFNAAADQRDAGEEPFNTPKGNKLIRILWANY